jgi:hypothetical protein
VVAKPARYLVRPEDHWKRERQAQPKFVPKHGHRVPRVLGVARILTYICRVLAVIPVHLVRSTCPGWVAFNQSNVLRLPRAPDCLPHGVITIRVTVTLPRALFEDSPRKSITCSRRDLLHASRNGHTERDRIRNQGNDGAPIMIHTPAQIHITSGLRWTLMIGRPVSQPTLPQGLTARTRSQT